VTLAKSGTGLVSTPGNPRLPPPLQAAHAKPSPRECRLIREQNWQSACREWGKVLAWDPPRRILLAWQITGEWVYDPNFLTELEVTFTATSPKQTRVELEHRNLERYGEAAAAVRELLNKGWELPLPAFAKIAEG
jgi:uncharacterized protein YndB with AHSA1/START domain